MHLLTSLPAKAVTSRTISGFRLNDQKTMNERINITVLESQAYKAIFGLDKYLGGTDIDPSSKELIKIRASQINGCAFCIQMHTEQARKQGEAEQRIYALSAWRESPLFTEAERVVLAMPEEITLISVHGVLKED